MEVTKEARDFAHKLLLVCGGIVAMEKESFSPPEVLGLATLILTREMAVIQERLERMSEES